MNMCKKPNIQRSSLSTIAVLHIAVEIHIYPNTRRVGKGFHRMLELMEWKGAKRLNFMFVGNDWEEVVAKGIRNGVTCSQYFDSQVKYPEGYAQLYDHIDYLLIPSKWEGGPICALEAAAKGLPIISANVGWVQEVAGFAQIFNNDEELKKILGSLTRESVIRRSYIDPTLFSRTFHQKFGYARCAEQIVQVAEKL
jgi:glycosyltransferase involved in cell wall biosynthesis